jgi:hypothetical protein
VSHTLGRWLTGCTLVALIAASTGYARVVTSAAKSTLVAQIQNDSSLRQVLALARSLVTGGLTAGVSYPEVWIRDLNTFETLDLQSGGSKAAVRQALVTFAMLQRPDGQVPDAYFRPKPGQVIPGAITTRSAPGLVVLTNTVESDQESSFVQAVVSYVRLTGDRSIVTQRVNGQTVLARMANAIRYVMTDRWDPAHGLVWSGITVDWGDVQAGTSNPVTLGPGSRRADSIYANAMLSLALEGLETLAGRAAGHWKSLRSSLDRNIQRWLWDPASSRYRAHLYLDGSPFPTSFNEAEVEDFGGTAVAIQANLLTNQQVERSLAIMNAGVKAAGAQSIGLAVWPTYPAKSFLYPSHPGLMDPGDYQNGGQWTWFGARMIQGLLAYGDIADAFQEVKPMVAEVLHAGGFYEWTSLSGQPKGSAGYRGTAGELGLALEQMLAAAR